MHHNDSESGPIMRLFEARAKSGCADELVRKFATTSADVVQGEAGNEGYFFGQGVADDGVVVFVSMWRDLDSVKARFGKEWQSSFLPEGYEALIEECSVRHVELRSGSRIRLDF